MRGLQTSLFVDSHPDINQVSAMHTERVQNLQRDEHDVDVDDVRGCACTQKPLAYIKKGGGGGKIERKNPTARKRRQPPDCNN